MKLPIVMIALFAVFVKNVDAVSIASVNSPIVAYNTYSFAVLPCTFTTPDSPEVTWYRVENGKRNLVAQRSMDGRHRVSAEFSDRVFFGNRGDLILIKPELHDSGRYSCEVDVDYDNPTWAKVDMEMIVKQLTAAMVPTTFFTSPVTSTPLTSTSSTSTLISIPCAQDKTVYSQHGIRFMIFLDWIIPIVCTVLLVLLSRVQDIFAKATWRNFLKSHVLAVITTDVCGFYSLGMVMVCGSILLFVEAVSSAVVTSQHNYLRAGLATGITGNIILILLTVLACLKERIPNRWISADKKRTEAAKADIEVPEIRKGEVVSEDAMEISPLQTLIPNNSDSDNNKNMSVECAAVSSSSTSYQKKRKSTSNKYNAKSIGRKSGENGLNFLQRCLFLY